MGAGFAGAGWYSTRTLLMTATVRPCVAVSWPAVVVASSTSPRMLTSFTAAGISTRTSSLPSGATALTPPGPAPPEMRSYEILRRSKFGLHGAPAEQIRLHRQHRHHGGVFRKASPGPDILVRVRVTIVQIEDQRGGAGVRGDRNPNALLRIAPGQDEAVGRAGLDAEPERLRTLELRRLDLGGCRRDGFAPGPTTLRTSLRCRQRQERDHSRSETACSKYNFRSPRVRGSLFAVRGRGSRMDTRSAELQLRV